MMGFRKNGMPAPAKKLPFVLCRPFRRAAFLLVALMLPALAVSGRGKDGYWQQRADYTLDVRLDVATNRMTGRQVIVYTNNSPDVLDNVYFHLYFNAFKPGS